MWRISVSQRWPFWSHAGTIGANMFKRVLQKLWRRTQRLIWLTPSLLGAITGVVLASILFNRWGAIYLGAILGAFGGPCALLWWIATTADKGESDAEAVVKYVSDRITADKLAGVFARTRYVGFLPDVTKALKHPDGSIRRGAAAILSELGRFSGESQTTLISAMGDTDRFVRDHAARALGQIGTPPATAALTEALNDEERFVRVAVVTALGQISSEVVVPSLLAALDDEDSWVRMAAVRALSKTREPVTLPIGNENCRQQDFAIALEAYERVLRKRSRYIADQREKGNDFGIETFYRTLLTSTRHALNDKQAAIFDLLHEQKDLCDEMPQSAVIEMPRRAA